MPGVKIDCRKIPRIHMSNLARVLCRDIRRTFNDPAVEEDFRRWQEEHKKQLEASAVEAVQSTEGVTQ